MALGDGIRRNIASIDPAERVMLRDALLELNRRVFPGTRTDPLISGNCSTGGVNLAGGVSWWFKQDEIHQATHVHGGPEFLPWHREIVNRLEQMLRQINPQLSLHYWDWTQDPTAILDANLGGGLTGPLNLFTSDFMGYGGKIPAPIGEPWLSAGYYVPGANPARDSSCNPADPPAFVNRSVVGSPASRAEEDTILSATDYAVMRGGTPTRGLEDVHNAMHGFVRMGGTHISFRDPFVFLLHSNVDRLFARWQTEPAYPERQNPDTVYGSESGDQRLNGNIEPWSTGHSIDTVGIEHFTRPWFAPENEGVPKTYKDPSVVTPPRYDTNLVPTVVDHFYTISAAERDNAFASFGYRGEGIACHVFASEAPGTTPLFRLSNQRTGDHFYTASPDERDNAIVSFGYQDEGIGWHAFASEPSATAALFRLSNQRTGDHFYTASLEERDNAIASFGYQNEGIGWYAFASEAPGTTPLFRLSNQRTGDHFYTASPDERDNAIASFGYQDEGVACHVFDSQALGTTPLFRLSNQRTGDHFYTISAIEHDDAIASFGYQDEGLACHVFASEPSAATPLFRLSNQRTGDHFYTASLDERDNAIARFGYQNEWIACRVFDSQAPGTTPLFRLLRIA